MLRSGADRSNILSSVQNCFYPSSENILVYVSLSLRTQAGSLPALVSAAVAIGYVRGDASVSESLNQNGTTASLITNTYVSAGFVVGIAALAIIVELVFIILRILNIGWINLKVKIFLIIVSSTELILPN